jgi:serine protease Do
MKKEFVKLGIMILILSFGIILISGNPIIKFYDNKKSFENVSLAQNVSVNDAVSLQETFVDVISRVKPAVVSIVAVYTYKVEVPDFYFGDPFEEFFKEFFNFSPQQKKEYQPKQKYKQYKTEGGGSGVIISPDGYILTNEHVVKNATEIKVIVNTDGNEKEYKGKIVGKDPRTDIAVVKINAKNLPYAKLGNSDKIKIGEWVIAIGSPFGLEQTVTVGVVSALRQRVRVEGREYKEFIQTDAAINRGNSGGPLCNIYGEVIGINTAIYAPTGVFSGIGFAIPINRAKEILDTLIQKGKVSRGWLGIEIVSVDEAIANQFGLSKKQGVLINRVLKDTPAEKAGLQRGDIIISAKIKNRIVDINSPQELQDFVFSLPPNENIELKIVRNKKEQVVKVTLGELPEETQKVSSVEKEGKTESYTWLGYKFVNLTNKLREKLGVGDDVEGVVVDKIDYEDKEYEDIGLYEMDIVISVNRKEVKNTSQLKEVLKSVDIKKGVVFDVIRDGKQMFVSFIKQ